MKQALGILLALTLLAGVAPARAAEPPGPAANQAIYLPLTQKAGQRTVVPGLPFDPFATYSGDATFYTYSGGACTLDPLPAGTLLTAINAPQYYTSLLCGAYLTVTGPAGTAQVVVADLCPECQAGDLDMNLAAFQAVTGASDGRVPITWQLASPPLSGPIAYRFQGSNPYYVKVQVLNHRNPVYSVELDTGAGGFVPLTRTSDGFFVFSPNSTPSPLTLRVTDIYSNTLIDSGIPIATNNQQLFTGQAQFPPAPL